MSADEFTGKRVVDPKNAKNILQHREIVPDPDEQNALTLIFHLYGCGYTIGQITNHLNKIVKQKFRGHRWSDVTIRKAIKRGRYPASLPDPREVKTP